MNVDVRNHTIVGTSRQSGQHGERGRCEPTRPHRLDIPHRKDEHWMSLLVGICMFYRSFDSLRLAGAFCPPHVGHTNDKYRILHGFQSANLAALRPVIFSGTSSNLKIGSKMEFLNHF